MRGRIGEQKRLRRICKKCAEKFMPTSKFSRYCVKCLDKIYRVGRKSKVYKD